MFCKNCGTELKETDKFCNSCGTQVKEDSKIQQLNILDFWKNVDKKTIITVISASIMILVILFIPILQIESKEYNPEKESEKIVDEFEISFFDSDYTLDDSSISFKIVFILLIVINLYTIYCALKGKEKRVRNSVLWNLAIVTLFCIVIIIACIMDSKIYHSEVGVDTKEFSPFTRYCKLLQGSIMYIIFLGIIITNTIVLNDEATTSEVVAFIMIGICVFGISVYITRCFVMPGRLADEYEFYKEQKKIEFERTMERYKVILDK